MDCVEVEREAHLVADRIADETVHAEIGALDLALSLETDGTDSEIGRIWERRVLGPLKVQRDGFCDPEHGELAGDLAALLVHHLDRSALERHRRKLGDVEEV